MKLFGKLFLTICFIGTGLVICAQPVQETPRDLPYEANLIKDRKILPYDHIREADVFWRKRIWRVIDTREKLNLPFVYPKAPFIGVLMDALKENQIQVYSALDDEFKQPLSYSELEQTLSKTDTVFTVSPITFNDTMIITVDEFNPLTVKKFRIKEDWIFDEETSTLVVRILGIAPVQDVFDQTTGELRGEKYMFWVYYPEARQLFANTPAYNPFNDAIQMSWEDIFEMRLFGSYIVKESNVYDREIQNYATGIDAVLESERIKMEIFKKEHELWSF